MADPVFARRGLYDHAWAEPMRAVARGLGVSDVGLAKACRAADLPTPLPRLVGQAPARQTPPSQTFPAGPPRPPRPRRHRPLPSPRPPLPAVEVASAAAPGGGEITVADDLRGAHAIVRGWVAQAAERRREHRRRG